MSRTKTTSRLITFEVEDDEVLLVRAGRDEMDNRTIFSGHAGGRYAIVPVDELTQRHRDDVDAELLVEELEVVGSTATIEADGVSTATLAKDGLEVARNDASGVYGLLWIPST